MAEGPSNKLMRGAPRVQGLVYIFIALAAAGVAAAAYFGLTFTPIEALVTAIAVGAVALLFMERQLRQRSEARLERAIEDLARLLSTDAQAGQVLSQRINQLADTNAGSRLDGIEADISVLGTVVRQVAEAVAEMEEAQKQGGAAAIVPAAAVASAEDEGDDSFPEPVIPIQMLREALAENRLVCHIEPILQLPQRRAFSYDVVPRLILEDAELADPPDFMPRSGHEDVARAIEAAVLDEAITIVRRARTAGQPLRLHLPLSRATTTDAQSVERLRAVLEANRAVADALAFAITQADWKQMLPSEKIALAQLHREGVSYALAEATSLRVDFSELEGMGFAAVRLDATRFLRNPAQFTDFHIEDVAAYARRYGVEPVATGVVDEPQVLTLFENGIVFVQGPHIGRPGPVRPDLVVERGEPVLRRVDA